MKLLITIKLSDRSMWNHISPIANLDSVDEIVIVRDSPGIKINKVRYVSIFKQNMVSQILNIPIKLIQIIQLIWVSIVEKPSLIHSYLLFPYGYLALIAGKLTGRKVGVSLIAGPVETYMLGGSPIGTCAYDRPLPPPNTLNSLIISILNKFDIITVTGSYTKNYLVSRGLDEDKLIILPHSVDERFRPLNVEKDYDVVFVGRLAEVKHVETIIHAISIVRNQYPSVRVAIVGDGRERKNLEIISDNFGLGEIIHFIGYQDNTWEWYNRAKMSILSSEREGFPYSVVESLKCGVPVIVSKCGDVADIVIDSFNGVIIQDHKNADNLARIIIDLLTHPHFLKELSLNCLPSVGKISDKSIEESWSNILNYIATH